MRTCMHAMRMNFMIFHAAPAVLRRLGMSDSEEDGAASPASFCSRIARGLGRGSTSLDVEKMIEEDASVTRFASRVEARLAPLSREQLVHLIVRRSMRDRERTNRYHREGDSMVSEVDNLLASVAPCPPCARGVLLSRDFLPMVLPFADLDHPWAVDLAANSDLALVCKAWATEWKQYLLRWGLPLRWSASRIAELPFAPTGRRPKRGRNSITLTEASWLACSDGLVFISNSKEYSNESSATAHDPPTVVCMNDCNEVARIISGGPASFREIGDLVAGGGKLFVADCDQLRVFCFDVASGSLVIAGDRVTSQVVGPRKVVNRMCLALAPDGSRLYVSHIRGVAILEPSTLKQVGRLSLPGGSDALRRFAFVQAMAVHGDHLVVCIHGPQSPLGIFAAYTLDGAFIRLLMTGPGRRYDSEQTWMAQRLVSSRGLLFAVEQKLRSKRGTGTRILVFAVNVASGCLHRIQSVVHPQCVDAESERGEDEDDDHSDDDDDDENPRRYEASITLQAICVRGEQLLVANFAFEDQSLAVAKSPLLVMDCGPSKCQSVARSSAA